MRHRVVHLEQQLETIALASQQLLRRPHAVVVEDVVYCDRHLIRHLLHELQVRFRVRDARQAAESKRAQATEGRGERDGAEGLHAILPHHRDQPGKANLAFNVVHDQALLRFPHQPCADSPTGSSRPSWIVLASGATRACRRMTSRDGSCNRMLM